MILSDRDIRLALQARRLVIEPWPLDAAIQPASVDVHLASSFLFFPADPDGMLDTRVASEMESYIVPEGKSLVLPSGGFVIASTVERLRLPTNMAARLEGKSKLARYGLLVHAAGWFDPGFTGTATLELKNISGHPLTLWPGDPIGQFSFVQLTSSVVRSYGHNDLGSHYQGQSGPTAARP